MEALAAAAGSAGLGAAVPTCPQWTIRDLVRHVGVDTERAEGVASSFPPPFAADGVDELLVGFIARPRLGLRAEPPRTLRIRAADAAGDWLVRIGPDGPVTAAGAPRADCEVHGPASDLYLALWSRQDPAGLTVQGDDEVFALFRERVHI